MVPSAEPAGAAATSSGHPPLGTNEQVAKDRALCDASNFKSCAYVGWGYYTGQGAPLDHKVALDFFKRACDQGVQPGCVPLGYMYQQGDVVPKDLDRAVSLFKPACEQGDFKVCIGLGELYEKEKADPSSAVVWFRKACAGGESDACAAEQRLKAQ